ncbi:SUMF1/EgtB/PvdO family nonheme iron enzyme [Marinifilum sp. RC60d5]|uniref:SUMF1/EgtB/PvdO family nonheme iron enzyme n=1 Tax=Marinifilum sp. RC60d5 TaxID=3458414 RepID=UPI00403722B1
MKIKLVLVILLLGSTLNFTNCSKDEDVDVKNTPPSSAELIYPADNATELDLSLSLDWAESTDLDSDDIFYDVYLSEIETELEDKLIAADLKTTSCELNELEYFTSYYWKVVAKDENDLESSSTIFSFTTKDKSNTVPTVPILTLPTDKSTDVALDLSLIWEESTDADGDKITYTVYLGESDNLSENELIASDVNTLNYKPEGLEYSKNYYWKVIAKDTKGASSSSSVFSFTTSANSSPSTDIEMITVQGGTFQMGFNYGDSDEQPIHTVTISSFEIGKYEVTQAQWESVMGSNPSYHKGDNLPVERVSWNTIQTFISKLNEQTGLEYRLPTEAEWEFAARGGNSSNDNSYAGSNTVEDVAWYDNNSDGKTHDIGTKQANELGIYDMSGNVYEWCSDWYYESYGSDAVTNPTGPTSGSSRVSRGGGWHAAGGYCHVANRAPFDPSEKGNALGLRLALSL